MEKHLVAHSSWGVNLPSVVGNEHCLPSVIVHGGYVLLPAVIDYRHVQLSASVGGEHSLLTVPVGDGYVLLPAVVAGGYVPPSALAG